MGTKEMILTLPEVKALTDKVPAATLFIEPSEIHLRYFQQAAVEKKPLRKQCEDLGVPWNARKIPADLLSMEAVEVARDLEPSLYAQAAPEEADRFRAWVKMMHNAPDLPEDGLAWLAMKGLEFFEVAHEVGEDARTILTAYVQHVGSLHKSTSPKRVLEYGMEHIRLDRWEAQRAAEREQEWHLARMNALLGPGRRYGAPDTKPHKKYPDSLRRKVLLQGFDFHLLETENDFLQEGRAMHHCVASYHRDQKAGRCHVASVRRKGKRLYTVEYSTEWQVIQVKGPCNTRLGDEPARWAIETFGAFARCEIDGTSEDLEHTPTDTDQKNEQAEETRIVVYDRGNPTLSLGQSAMRETQFNVGLLCLLVAGGALSVAAVVGALG